MITAEKVDAIFASLHKEVMSGEITKEEYEAKLNVVEAQWPKFIHEHFKNRPDNRTLGQFGVYLLTNSRIEKHHADWWFPRYARKHFGEYESYECIGVDQSGVLLCNVSENLDYEMKHPLTRIEVKDCAIATIGDKLLHKATYKEASVKACIKNDAYLLTVFRKRGDNERKAYSLTNPQQLKRIDEECEYEPRHEMGGKSCCQFFLPGCEDRKQYGSKDLSPNAQELTEYMDLHYG